MSTEDAQSAFVPCPEIDLETGEEFPAIDRLFEARGYIGAQYIGRDPSTDALYYRLPEIRKKYAWVPALSDIVEVD